MNIVVSILGRSTMDQPFAELVAPATLIMSGDRLAFTPSIPAAASGQELRLRVRPDNGVIVALGSALDPATRPGPTPRYNDAGAQIGTDPAPLPVVSRQIGIWAGQVRDIPLNSHETVIFLRNGATLVLN